MSNGPALATKLRSEGEHTLAFFTGLAEEDWQQALYLDGAEWRVRDALEHLIQSEASLRVLFRKVVVSGEGAPANFDIDGFNRERTGRLAALTREQLLQRFTHERNKTADFASELTVEQLALRGRHPALGDSSIEEMLKMIYLHNTMHVRDIKKVT